MTNPRIIHGLRAAIAALSVALASFPSAAETFTCPAVFPAQTLKFSPADNGWMTGAGDPAPLYSTEVFDGPPEQRASLQPADSGKGSSTWKFEGPYPLGIWLQCSYADGALTLTRRLAHTPTTCVARYPRLSKGRPTSVSFDCR